MPRIQDDSGPLPVFECRWQSSVARDALRRRSDGVLRQDFGQLVCIVVAVVVCTLAVLAAAIRMSRVLRATVSIGKWGLPVNILAVLGALP